MQQIPWLNQVFMAFSAYVTHSASLRVGNYLITATESSQHVVFTYDLAMKALAGFMLGKMSFTVGNTEITVTDTTKVTPAS